MLHSLGFCASLLVMLSSSNSDNQMAVDAHFGLVAPSGLPGRKPPERASATQQKTRENFKKKPPAQISGRKLVGSTEQLSSRLRAKLGTGATPDDFVKTKSPHWQVVRFDGAEREHVPGGRSNPWQLSREDASQLLRLTKVSPARQFRYVQKRYTLADLAVIGAAIAGGPIGLGLLVAAASTGTLFHSIQYGYRLNTGEVVFFLLHHSDANVLGLPLTDG